jgi:hypothetical protein
MRRIALIAVAVAVTVPIAAAAPSAATGEQRVLVLLATWGPEPWRVAEVAQAAADADVFLRKTSLHQLGLRITTTAWLKGYPEQPDCPPPEHTRIPVALTAGPEAAAEAAGYSVASYDRVVYVVPRIACPWLAVGVGRQVMLNGTLSAWTIVHELGHTYGLAHAYSKACKTGSCSHDEYGDPFSPMGHGLVDFSAYEKVVLGWIQPVGRVERAGSYSIGRTDLPGATPEALVIPTGAGEYWFEQRPEAETPGLAARIVEPDIRDDDLAAPISLIENPTGGNRPTIAQGETFRVPGVLSLRYDASGEGRATVAFEWLDRTPPRIRLVAPARLASGRQARVSWAATDAGSGVVSCTLSVDRRVVMTGEAKGAAAVGPLRRGRHQVAVTCVDRAANRSRPTIRSVRVFRR